MQQTGTELPSLPRFPVEFIDIPAIQRDTEVRPNKTANDYGEKPFHDHGKKISMAKSIRSVLGNWSWMVVCSLLGVALIVEAVQFEGIGAGKGDSE